MNEIIFLNFINLRYFNQMYMNTFTSKIKSNCLQLFSVIGHQHKKLKCQAITTLYSHRSISLWRFWRFPLNKRCSIRITVFRYSYFTVRVTTSNSSVPSFHWKDNDRLYRGNNQRLGLRPNDKQTRVVLQGH